MTLCLVNAFQLTWELNQQWFNIFFLNLLGYAIQHNYVQHNDIQNNDIQHNDIQHYDIQHNDIQHNDIQHNDIQHNDSEQAWLIFGLFLSCSKEWNGIF